MIMKKTYKKPTTEIIDVALQNMIAASEINKGGSYSGGTIQSREGGFWGDDDEE